MTAPIFDPNSPRYQRLLSKVNAMSSEQKGLLNTFLSAGAGDVAAMDMKNYIALAELGAKRDQTESMVSVGEKKTEALYGPEGIYTKEMNLKHDIAEKGIASKERIAGRNADVSYDIGMSRIAQEGELKQDLLDFKADQIIPSAAIGGANVILSGAIGYAELAERQKQAKKLDDMAARINRTGALG